MYGAERISTGRSQKMVPSLVWFLLCASCYLRLPDCASSLSADGVTLINLRAAIKSDPNRLLSDWKDDGTDPCTWKGVGCDHSARVVSLNISNGPLCGREGFPVDCTLDHSASLAACSSVSSENFTSLCSSFGWFSGRDSRKSCMPVCRRSSNAHNLLDNGTSVCGLTGFLSPVVGNLLQLRNLSLPFNAFAGVLPKEIGGLRFLEVLDLRGNGFSGFIPAEFGQLSRLKTVNLAYNSLEGNVPVELSGCRNLQVFNLAGNMLSGSIPNLFGSLPGLQVLALSFNNLSGTIPTEVTRNCANLEHFHVEDNLLSGTIPVGFGNCSRLRSLVLSSNVLSGSIPEDVGQLQMLQLLDVSRNSLGDKIPSQLGNCSQLSVLVLTNYLDTQSCGRHFVNESMDGNYSCDKIEFNYFLGLPVAIMTLPKLQILWAPFAAVSGALPIDWGNCQSLKVLNLAGNSISGNVLPGLAKCHSLIYLDLSANMLEGNIPQELSVSCMVVFNVSENYFTGGLPNSNGTSCPRAELLNPYILPNLVPLLSDDLSFARGSVHFYFSSLYCGSVARNLPVWFPTEGIPVVHDMSENSLTGPITGLPLGTSLVEKIPAYGLFVSGNQLMGAITSSLFESCAKLQTLCFNFSKNSFSGELPAEAMVNCISLRQFDAAFNQLTGSIPHGLGRLNRMVYLNMGMNKFSGELPSQVGQLQELQYLLLANNNLTGRIPEDFGRLTSLLRLDLSNNRLTGRIPTDLANLNQLRWLFLSNNNLSGVIPLNFAKLNHLVVMDVAFNNLSGPVPHIGKMESLCANVWITGNEFIESCSASAPVPSMQGLDAPLPYADPLVARKNHQPNSVVIAAVTSGCAIAAVLIILVMLFQFTKHPMPMQSGYRSGPKQIVMFRNFDFHLTYDNVIAATGNFSLNNLIGTGGFGSTYKAELRPGLLVAVKKLSLGRFQGTQQFDAEIRTLGRIQHPNLVTLIGYHASESQMFLIYNYLPGGNLENLIHDRRRGIASWRVRYKIALSIAQALAYLHDECTPRVLHRDIKPSNVLLDTNLNAFLSDFGLARLLGASETHATTDVAGTFGYVAPEYAMTCRLSDKADVYSYGVVLLELLSGKRALDQSFSDYGHGFNIVAWASQLYHKGRAPEVFTPGLWEQGPHSELCSVLKLAVKCTMISLSVRPTMKQVVDHLKSVR